MLPCLLGSPTLVKLAGRPLFASRLRLRDFALLLSEGAIALGEDPDAYGAAAWGSAAFYGWLAGEGVGLFLWCVLRENDPRPALAECESLAAGADPAEVEAVYRAAMRKRSREARPGPASDIAEHRWGRTVKRLRATMSYAQIADLTLDQLDLEMTRAEDADAEADAKDRADFAAIDELRRKLKAEAAAKTPSGPVPPGVDPAVMADVEALGFRVVGGGPDVV